MLRAFSKVLVQVPEAKLVVVGEGPEMEQFGTDSQGIEAFLKCFFPWSSLKKANGSAV